MVSTEASRWNILWLKIYTTLGYIVKQYLIQIWVKFYHCINKNFSNSAAAGIRTQDVRI